MNVVCVFEYIFLSHRNSQLHEICRANAKQIYSKCRVNAVPKHNKCRANAKQKHGKSRAEQIGAEPSRINNQTIYRRVYCIWCDIIAFPSSNVIKNKHIYFLNNKYDHLIWLSTNRFRKQKQWFAFVILSYAFKLFNHILATLNRALYSW